MYLALTFIDTVCISIIILFTAFTELRLTLIKEIWCQWWW